MGNTYMDLLGARLLAKNIDQLAEVQTADALKGKYVALYFSASWCPPCRAFTPVLRKLYLLCTAKKIPLEIVFVSSDKNVDEFKEYFLQHMPWLAVPYENSAARQALSRKVGVMGIPTLCIIDPEGNMINSNARAAVIKDPECAKFPWAGQQESALAGYGPALLMALLFAVYYLWKHFA